MAQSVMAQQLSSPATLLVSRNVAIDCVQLQVRVHSAQQRSRALLASLLLPKNDSISFAHSISVLLSPFSRRRQNCHTVWTNQIAACTCSNTSTFPAGAKLSHCLDQSDCSAGVAAGAGCNLIGPHSVPVLAPAGKWAQ